MPNATKGLVLSLEQSVLDNCVCAYNINPTAGSLAGAKHSDEAKAKMSARKQGAGNPRFNQGKAVYLYVVHAHGLELQSTHLSLSYNNKLYYRILL